MKKLVAILMVLGIIACWWEILHLILVRRFKNYGAVRSYNLITFFLVLVNILGWLPIGLRLLTQHLGIFSHQLLLFAIMADLVITIGLIVFTLLTWLLQLRGLPTTADYVIVLGAGLQNGRVPPVLKARLKRAVECWHALPKVKIVVTGGYMRGEKVSEAQAMQEYLMVQGIPAGQILEETTATNSWENLRASDQLIQADWHHQRQPTVVVVTSSFHILRVWTYARKQRLPYHFCAAPTPVAYQPMTITRDYFGLLRDHRRILIAIVGIVIILAELMV